VFAWLLLDAGEGFIKPPYFFETPLTATFRHPPTMSIKARVLRDMKARQGVLQNEVTRRAYLAVARNQTLPTQVRFQAQLQLNNMGKYTRPGTVKNRCTATGRGRGVMSEFGLCRYQFRLRALQGLIPGVSKASW